jgi:hypothetical protein
MAGNREQGQFTHIVLLVDASTSMRSLRDAVVRVVDGLIKEWEQQAVALNDMTRLTLYQFSSENYMPNGTFIECIAYDTDIARVGGVLKQRAEAERAKGNRGSWYQPHGNTALIDSTIHALGELALIPTIHGDHTCLFYSVTDGGENQSPWRAEELVKTLENLPEDVTVAALVPNIHGKVAAQRYGYPAGNIMVWDATSAQGVEEAGRAVAQATASYMESRTKTGLRSTRSLFVGGNVDAKAIKEAKLTPLHTDDYAIVPVAPIDGLVEEKPDPSMKKPPAGQPDTRPMVSYMQIEPFISRVHPPFRVGKTFYQLIKAERVKGNKKIAVLEHGTSKVYVGSGVRQMLGLPEEDRTIRPDENKKYTIFVESTSTNRHLLLLPRPDVLVLTK